MSEQSAVSGQQSADDARTLAESGFYWRERDGVKVLVCRPLEDAGFANGFSTRLGGVSAFSLGHDLNLAGFDEDEAENIYENRRRFLATFDGEYRLATVWQVHGDTIKTVRTLEDIGNSEDRADALVSDLSGILVGAKTADCVPVLLGDSKTGAFAAVHAGWRGTVRSIVRKAVEQMTATYGTNASDIIAAIGPAACGRNYEVGEDVIGEFGENFAESEKYFTATRDSHALVDLHLANRDQLTAIGVNDANIFTAPFCTMERSDLFFSYRLEKKTFGKTGRLLSVIGRT
ncbi:MAG: peptidoglycan editing factor PgeF [Acidobacteria bacterium]|nr:peptidoglycan editing factor PgeF [Acidobacteriota bacterium]